MAKSPNTTQVRVGFRRRISTDSNQIDSPHSCTYLTEDGGQFSTQ